MTDDLFYKPPRESPTRPAATPATIDRAQRDRAAWILSKARLVFGAYRKDEFADPDLFLSQLCLLLERYSDAVIEPITDVRNPYSLQRKYKFPPAIAEISETADAEGSRQATARRWAQYRSEPREPRPKQHPANVLIPGNHSSYATFRERAELEPDMALVDPEGRLWVPMSWVTEARGTTSWRRFTVADLEAIYRRHDSNSDPIEHEPHAPVSEPDASDRAETGPAGLADVEAGGTGRAE